MLQIPDTFFASLLSGRIQSFRDERGAFFIDRDPDLFSLILNYLRTKDVDLKKCDIRALKIEAEFYALSPLIKRLMLIDEMDHSSCGNLLFYCLLPAPNIPLQEYAQVALKNEELAATSSTRGSLIRSESSRQSTDAPSTSKHSRNSSWDMRVSSSRNIGHSRNPSFDLRHHSRTSSADLNKFIKNDLGVVLGQLGTGQNWIDPLRVQIIKAHHNCIAVAYSHFFICYRMKDSSGWQLVFTSPFIDSVIERIAINSKMTINAAGELPNRMVAISYGNEIKLWGICEDGQSDIIGTFNLGIRVEYLFFIGNQLVALSSSGKIGVWHSGSRHFQGQDLFNQILSFDYAGSFLLLGCANGCIYYIGRIYNRIIA